MKRLLLICATLVAACTAPDGGESIQMAVREAPVEMADGQRVLVANGPGYSCGLAFAINLEAGEALTTRDRGMDFVTHVLDGPQGGALLYEGNYPQPSDAVVETGESFPSLVAIHGRGENRAVAAARVQSRIVTGDMFDRICSEGE